MCDLIVDLPHKVNDAHRSTSYTALFAICLVEVLVQQEATTLHIVICVYNSQVKFEVLSSYLLDIWYFRLSFGTWRICILRWWAGWSWGMIVINTRFYQKINQHIKSREIAGIVTRSSHVIITKIMTTSQSKEIILSIVHLHNCCLTQVTLLSNNQLQRRQYCTTFSRKEHFFGMPYGELTLLVSLCARHYR